MYELRLILDDPTQKTAALLAMDNQHQVLREFLARFPAQPAPSTPIAPDWYDLPLSAFDLRFVRPPAAPSSNPGTPAGDGQTDGRLSDVLNRIHTEETASAAGASAPVAAPAPAPEYPDALTDSEAVQRAYATEIQQIARYLDSDLSVLVVCDKVLAEYIHRYAVKQSRKTALLPDLPDDQGDDRAGASRPVVQEASRRIAHLSALIGRIKESEVLVLRHLDLLAGGAAEGPLPLEARQLTEVLYHTHDFTPTLLGFADPSADVPRVLANRFAVRLELQGLSRAVLPRLITRAEVKRFAHFDAETLFKNVSGFNAIQLRNAMRYLNATSMDGTPTPRLMELIRDFKRGSSDEVEIPNVSFDDIGGYRAVKEQLFEAIELITGRRPPFNADGSPYRAPVSAPVPETDAERDQRRKMAPRGFIFYGPPGTGKTLFAKAIANAMNATIQMVSGPEIMDMWVGKSESNLRRLFTIARRNAPAVICFDEFDSIAAARSGFSDGGSRASNAVVAQLLTELDGFRADQDILVIGTTNQIHLIDPALLRPSRFQPIEIGLPDEQARTQIARIHARNFQIEPEHDAIFALIGEHTDGFNGDEIRAIFQELARQRRRGEPITAESFGIQIGLIRNRRDQHLISATSATPRVRR